MLTGTNWTQFIDLGHPHTLHTHLVHEGFDTADFKYAKAVAEFGMVNAQLDEEMLVKVSTEGINVVTNKISASISKRLIPFEQS